MREVADALWPRECIVCGSDDPVIAGEVCVRCWGGFLAAEPRKTPKPLQNLQVAFAYDPVMQTIIHRFKFEHATKLAQPLAQRFAGRIEQMRFRVEDSAIVPVPDHPTRKRERGYNPRYELARFLAERWERPLRPDVVQRSGYGPHQANLPTHERRNMPRNTFRASAPESGEESTHLILIDDVVSTGTTLTRCASALRRAGWKKISAMCLSG
jgi:ComF family protein